jgi:WD40 repeat protein
MLLVSRRVSPDDNAAVSYLALLALDPAVWDPVADEPVDELADGVLAAWFGRDLVGGTFAGSDWLYDVNAHTPVASNGLLPRPSFLWTTPDGGRTYGSVVDAGSPTGPRCEIRTYDADRRLRREPTIVLDGDGACSFETSVSATRDGRRVVVTTGGGSYLTRRTTVHDGRTGEQIAGPRRGLVATSVSPDGVLVGGDASGALTQYDLETLEPIRAFPGTRAGVSHLRFSADGMILTAVAWNQTVSIYDVATHTRLGDPIANDFLTGALRPDGRAIATGSADGVAIWDIDPEHLAEAACRLAGRNLTASEWGTYLGDEDGWRATCSRVD